VKGWPALLGALGAVIFGFGFLSLILWIFQPAADLRWVIGNLAVGFVLIAGSLVASLDTLRERMQSGEAQRVGRYGSSAVMGTVLSIAILCGIAFLTTRHSVRFDWSEQKINTLSGQTLELLARLERDVEMTAFFNAAESPPVRNLLERYVHASERVSLTFADPNQRPDLIEAYGIDPSNLTRGLIRIAVGENSLELDQFSESEITNALLKLLQSDGRRIVFLEGHNERAIEGERGEEPTGFSQAAAALRNETYEVDSILLASLGDVPADVDLLILAGPTRPLSSPEHEALARYLERGGALMVMVDPRAKTDLAEDLRSWGVVLGEDVVFDAKLALFGQATTPFSGRYENHPITEKMRDTVIFHMARSVQVAEEAAGDLQELVFTGEDAWAETDLQGWTATGEAKYDVGDLLGPVPLMVAGTAVLGMGTESDLEPMSARLVVFGDSDFASNELIASYQNRDLFVNAVNWGVDDTDQISVRPPVSRASRFQMTGEQFTRIQTLSLFVLPEAIAIAGVVAWWVRRKRPGT
jgi:ABC-type uncharacterized transport system involved in gliding motility auxiliary subunit